MTYTTVSGFSDYAATGGVLGLLWFTFGSQAPQEDRSGLLRDESGIGHSVRNVTDGLSNTFLVAEIAGRNRTYARGRDVTATLGPTTGGLSLSTKTEKAGSPARRPTASCKGASA